MDETDKVKTGQSLFIGGANRFFTPKAAEAFNAWLEIEGGSRTNTLISLRTADGEVKSFHPSQIKNALSEGRVAEPGQSLGTTYAGVDSDSDSFPRR